MDEHDNEPATTAQDPPVPGAPSDNVTMTDVIDALEDDGYTAQLTPLAGGQVECGECGATSPAGEFDVGVRRRLEGASDPDDMSTVIAATCPACGTGGTMVLGYGVNASEEDIEVGRLLGDVSSSPDTA